MGEHERMGAFVHRDVKRTSLVGRVRGLVDLDLFDRHVVGVEFDGLVVVGGRDVSLLDLHLGFGENQMVRTGNLGEDEVEAHIEIIICPRKDQVRDLELHLLVGLTGRVEVPRSDDGVALSDSGDQLAGARDAHEVHPFGQRDLETDTEPKNLREILPDQAELEHGQTSPQEEHLNLGEVSLEAPRHILEEPIEQSLALFLLFLLLHISFPFQLVLVSFAYRMTGMAKRMSKPNEQQKISQNKNLVKILFCEILKKWL